MIDNTIALFADDSKCSNVMKSTDDCVSLLNDLKSLQTWCRNWQLRFNSSKCEVPSVTWKRNPLLFDYKIGGISLSHVSSQKDLGVTVTSDLKWNRHINNITSKGYKTLGFLRRHTRHDFDTDTRRLLYLTFVKPHLNYASEIWAPQSIGNISKAKSLQRRATKYILHLDWKDNTSYHKRLVRLNLLPISYTHEINDLLFYFRCRLGYYNICLNDFVQQKNVTRPTRNNSVLDLSIPMCRTKLFQTSYFNRLPK